MPLAFPLGPVPLRILPFSTHLSGKGRGLGQHPGSITLDLSSLFKLPPLSPLVQNVILWAKGCPEGGWGWSRGGGLGWHWGCCGGSGGARMRQDPG